MLNLSSPFKSLAALFACIVMVHAQDYKLYVSGYSGIITPFTFTPPSTLTQGPTSPGAQNLTGPSPSWLTFDSQNGLIYATNEVNPNGSISAVKDDGNQLSLVGQSVPTNGGGPVASALGGGSDGNGVGKNCIYVANYNSGSASVLSLDSTTGALSTSSPTTFQYSRPGGGVGPVSSRQDHSYAHEVVASPDGAYVLVPDLGADQIHHIQTSTTSDCTQAKNISSTTVASGSGPRHVAFYPPTPNSQSGSSFVYLASELACSLTAFSYDAATSQLTQIGEPLQATPPGVALGGSQASGPQRTVSEVAVSSDGKYVYVGGRGDPDEDHIVIFKRSDDGSVEFQEWIPSGGKNVRHFSLSPDSKYLAAGNQDTGNVLIFERNESNGTLTRTGAEASNLAKTAFAGFAPSGF